jgi:hypothetical protein
VTGSTNPAGDPATVIALIYRVLDEPRRTLNAIAVTSLPLGTLVQVLGAPQFVNVPWWCMGAGGTVTALAGSWLIAFRQKRRPSSLAPEIPAVDQSKPLDGSMEQQVQP